MNAIEYSTVDKSGWGPGAWQDEPDKVQWPDEATGLPCLAVRNRDSGNWCGYVGVPPGHALHGKDYNDVDAGVHGGLTFADACHPGDTEAHGICHVPGDGEPEHVWWFGFDCAHAYDLSPGREAYWRKHGEARFLSGPETIYRTLAYVKADVATLAEQLRRLG